MELTLALDADGDETLHAQVFEQVRKLILSGSLRPGQPLPSSRELAGSLCISRNTVLLGYERLTAEGYIESRGTAGTFVSSSLPDDLLRVSGGQPRASELAEEGEPDPVLCFAGSPGGAGSSGRPEIDFWVGRSAAESFPVRAWRKLLSQTLSSPDIQIADYSDPVGLAELRQAISHHLSRSRGMSVDAEQIVVTSGSQDGLNLVHRLLLGTYDTIFVENPCYQGAALLFQSLGIKAVPIPVDASGLRVDKLPRTKSSLVFVTPSHQFPTGATLTLERRIQLLKWAEETDSLIIEDDYDSDFRYDGPPLTALAGLDNSRRVFYLGTFSKSLGAGLRLGYAVVPSAFSKTTRQTKAFMNNGQPWLEQVVLAEFLRSGAFDRHLRRVRKIYRDRRDHLVACLRTHFPETTICGHEAGLHFIWKLPRHYPPASQIQLQARGVGIGIYSLRSGAAIDLTERSPDNIILLGYSSVAREDITRAVRKLRALIDTQTKPSQAKRRTSRTVARGPAASAG